MMDLISRQGTLARRVRDLETQESIPIVARYSTDAAQSIPNTTPTIVNFEDLSVDTWSAVTVGAAWKFTAPVGGYYRVSARVFFAASVNWADTENCSLSVYKNGVLWSTLGYLENFPSGVNAGVWGSDIVDLAENDTIDIRVNQASGASLALTTNGAHNYVAIDRIGD
jgi:hypothetical protein